MTKDDRRARSRTGPEVGRPSTRERLLEATSELVYRQGVGVSSVDELAAAAGVSKPTVYALFGSKEELVRQTLERRRLARQRQIDGRLAELGDPERQLQALLELHSGAQIDGEFRGCPLVAAAVELPDSADARATAAAFKEFLRTRLAAAAKAAGYRDPERLASGLLLLIEGAIVMAYVRGRSSGPDLRRAWATMLAAHRDG